jgi:hypothetical protein
MSLFALTVIAFALGVLLGMKIGPSKEAREALRIEGYIDGLAVRAHLEVDHASE